MHPLTFAVPIAQEENPDHPIDAVSAKVTQLGQRFHASDVAFPLRTCCADLGFLARERLSLNDLTPHAPAADIIALLERFSLDHKEEAQPGWVAHAIRDAGVPFEAIFPVFDELFTAKVRLGRGIIMLPPADIKLPPTDPTLAHLVRARLPRRRHCRIALDLARRSVFGTFLPHSSLPRHRGRIRDRAVSDGPPVGDECGNVGDKAAGHAAGDSEEVLKGWCNLVAFSLLTVVLVRCSCRERRAWYEGRVSPLRTARLSFGPTTLRPALLERLALVADADADTEKEENVTRNQECRVCFLLDMTATDIVRTSRRERVRESKSRREMDATTTQK